MIIRRFSEDCQFTSLQVQKTTKITLQKWPKICGNVFLVKCSDIRPRGKEERLLSIIALFLTDICFLAYFGVSGDSDVPLQHSTKGKSVTQGVRIERWIVGQICCLSRCALRIGIFFNWAVCVSSQNAVLHGRRWPHFQIRMARFIETGRIIRLEELCPVQINEGDGYLIRLGRSRANSFSSSSNS